MTIRSAQPVNGITQGVIWRQLLVFFFPILFGTFFQQLYNTADAVIVGNFVGKEALAAVGGATSVLINFLVNIFVGISSGATVVISQKFGAGAHEDVQKALHTAVVLSVIGGFIMMVVGILAAPAALRAMGTPEEVMDGSVTYITVYFLGMIAAFLYNVGSGVLRAVGDTRRPLYFLIAACLTNIVLDLLLVVVLKMGVLGVALATLISQVLSAVLVILALCKAEYPLRLTRRGLRLDAASLRGILKVGLPAGLQSNMYAISNIIIQSCINSFGTDTIAAWTAFGKIDGLFWMIMGAFGISITTFVGQNFGAQQYQRMRKSVWVCMGMALFATVVLSSFYLAFATPLYRMFTSDANVIEVGLEMLWYMSPYYFTFIAVEIFAGAIRGTGDSLIPMLLTCGGICVMRIVWIVFVLPLAPEIKTVVVSYPITWVITSILFLVYYLQGGWLRRSIARAGLEPEQRPARRKLKEKGESIS